LANRAYETLTEGQKSIDRFIADKINEAISALLAGKKGTP